MNTSKTTYTLTKGSALITVVFLVFIMAMLSASIIAYSSFELRSNERTRLSLRSENVAENIALYAAEQLTAKLQRMGTAEEGHFPWSGPATNTRIVYMPLASTTDQKNVLASEYNTVADAANMEVRAGIEAKTDYALVTDTTNPNNGLQVATANVPIIAKGTATHPSLGTITTYVEQDMQLTLIPLFQFGMFYNMDLELYPSGNFNLTGPVHTNNSLLAHPDAGSTNSITFMGRISAADYIFAYQGTKCDTRYGDGTISTPGDPTKGFVKFTDANDLASQISMKSVAPITAYNNLTVDLWADCRWGDTTRNITTALPTTTQLANFKSWATNTYHGYVRAGIHGVTKLVLPGIGGYKETNDASTPEDDRNNGRQIIESPDHKRYNGSSFNATTDTAELKLIKISWRAGLYIMANPSSTARSGKLPNGVSVSILPRSYRCWLNTPSGTGHACTEVILPGQPSYGQDPGPDGVLDTSDDSMYLNYLPNRMMMGTTVGSNQVLRTIQQTYGTGTGYTVSAAAVTDQTALTISAGTGTILAGDVVTIGSYNYLVASDLVGTALTLASPGLRANASAGATVTINAPANNIGTGTGYKINKSSAPAGYSAGTTGTPVFALAVDTGTGTILPGNTISIGSGAGTYKYLVTAVTTAAPHTTLWIAKPGLVAAVSDNTDITIDPATGTLGTATDYVLNGAHAINTTSLTVNSGVGTLLPGNIVKIGNARYLVASAANSDTATTALATIRITPGLLAATPAAAPAVPPAAAVLATTVFVDPYAYTGYATTGNGGSGSVYPGDASTNAYAAEAYFYDIRRANNNGAISSATGTRTDFNRSTTSPYTPRPIAKIDLDMARLKMMVNRVISSSTSSTGYKLTLPDTTGTGWGNCIYNGDTTTPPTTTALGLGIYDPVTLTYTAAASFPDPSPSLRQNPFDLYKAPTTAAERSDVLIDPTTFKVSSASLSAAWYDGVAIYIHSVDAEVRAQTTTGIADRVDSGVRLWNGRGPVASLTASSKTGCTIATNDAVYIVGHYNANGTVSAASSHTPDADEYLCSVFGDATTILSQPTYTQTGTAAPYTYNQSAGWSDTYSALPASASSDGWESSAAGGQDGVYNATALKPGTLPTINKPGTLGTGISVKFTAVDTEVSTALVIGIVPSNHNPSGLTDRPPSTGANNVNSGGANNFPRFLEIWGDSNPLYIRGSMVALFESRVAMEPFTHSRCYDRPVRNWGLHDTFSLANHDVPLEPIVYSADRLGFRRLTAQQYKDRKKTIEDWDELLP